VLGVRATFDGLLIDPVIPSAWKEFTFERLFRSTRYIIHVSNPDGVQKGVRTITINGHLVQGQILPLHSQERVEVEVIMGQDR
jgi:cellobiose phosphorylase